MYRYVIVFDHYTSQLEIFKFQPIGFDEGMPVNELIHIIENAQAPSYNFCIKSELRPLINDSDFMNQVVKVKSHIQRGDVFQLVLSQPHEIYFSGDDFELYRIMRQINPSPYLFYFDFGKFRLIGSSPEAQILIKKGIASIHPIAGTYKRTGNDEEDEIRSMELASDNKENAEHNMLVDLARNDLSMYCKNVVVSRYKEIQKFSHVLHMVSEIKGQLKNEDNFMHLALSSFPAGTLSGAPKYRAMQIINKLEVENRGFYGGCIGFIGFNNEFNHAIIIRTVYSAGNKMIVRAGAGIVSDSIPENECNEVKNKLAALVKAMDIFRPVTKSKQTLQLKT
jgi:anthranilate synthase component 1